MTSRIRTGARDVTNEMAPIKIEIQKLYYKTAKDRVPINLLGNDFKYFL